MSFDNCIFKKLRFKKAENLCFQIVGKQEFF
jgi:hypothetical protein